MCLEASLKDFTHRSKPLFVSPCVYDYRCAFNLYVCMYVYMHACMYTSEGLYASQQASFFPPCVYDYRDAPLICMYVCMYICMHVCILLKDFTRRSKPLFVPQCVYDYRCAFNLCVYMYVSLYVCPMCL